ncbi:MAG: hypothetical protein AB8G05_21550 [Oligoflexales bacterium]
MSISSRTKLTLIFIGFLLGACGLQKSMYVDYTDEAEVASDTDGTETSTDDSTDNGSTDGTDGGEVTDGGDGSTDDGCAAALTAFTTNIAPAVASSCGTSNCHGGSFPIAGEALVEGDDASNRAIFLSFDTSEDGSTLFGKLSGSSGSHGGGDQSGSLSQDAVSTWKTAEQGCTEEG